MTVELALKPAAARGLAAWHKVVASLDAGSLGDLLRDDVVFRSPVRPMSGLSALGKEMGRRVGATLPALKGKDA